MPSAQSASPALKVRCRRCGASVGIRCWDLTTKTVEFHTKNPHPERVRAALDQIQPDTEDHDDR